MKSFYVDDIAAKQTALFLHERHLSVFEALAFRRRPAEPARYSLISS